MKTNRIIIRLALAAAVAFAGATTANAQFGGLKKMAKGVKEKAEKAADKVDKAKNKAKKAAKDVTAPVGTVIAETRGEAPWPMNGVPQYTEGVWLNTFVEKEINGMSQAELETMRDALFQRFREDVKIVKSNVGPVTDASNELDYFWELYAGIRNQMYTMLTGISVKDGNYVFRDDPYVIAGSGAFVFGTSPEYFKFYDKSGNGKYVSGKDLDFVKDKNERVRKYALMTTGLKELLKETGEDDADFETLVDLCNYYNYAVDTALSKNTSANITRQSRPKSGSLESGLKSQALAAAKNQNSKVIDVIITSSNWDIKKKNGVPTHRSVYGYWIIEDPEGKMCLPRMWQQDYQGGGKYGSLRAGGVGMEEPFYLK